MNYTNQQLEQSKVTTRRILLIVLGVLSVFLITYIVSYQMDFFSKAIATEHSELTTLAALDFEYPEVQGIQIVSPPVSKVRELDYRAYVLDEYFRTHNSPLYGTGRIFVDACNRYGAPADCTTVAAIAHAETSLCKYHTSAEYYNCWGFGGGGEHRIYFSSWNESIDLVTDRLVNAYGIKYMIDPSLMETTFCGSEPGCTNWGARVKYYMKKISDFPLSIGLNKTMYSFR